MTQPNDQQGQDANAPSTDLPPDLASAFDQPQSEPASSAAPSGSASSVSPSFGAHGVPMARPASPSAPADPHVSILELADSTCPKCHAVMGESDVVCVKCGYDLKANVVRTPEIGVVGPPLASDGDSSEAKPRSSKPEFVPASRGGGASGSGSGNVQPMLIIGGIIGLLSLVAMGIGAGHGGGTVYILATLLLGAYRLLINSAIGIAAVALAAWVLGFRMSRYELAGARMFVVTSSFLLVTNLWIVGLWIMPDMLWIPKTLCTIGGGLTYWLLVMVLFKKDRQPAAAVMIAHAALWFLLHIGMALAAWVATLQPSAPATPAVG